MATTNSVALEGVVHRRTLTRQRPRPESDPIALVLSRLEPYGLRQNGHDRWRACCPAHGGNNRSTLSIGVSDAGAVLLRCWVGCEVASVVGALSLDVADLFPRLDRPGGGAVQPRRLRLLTAGQALDLLDEEMTLGIVVLSDLARGVALDEPTRARVLKAAARVSMLRQEVRR